MVDPISGSSPSAWNPTPDGDEDGRRRTATRPRPPVVPDPPELPDVHAALLVRAAKTLAPRVGLTDAVDNSTVRVDAGTLQQRLRAFFDASKPTYRVPVGDKEFVEVEVPTPFRMAVPTGRQHSPPDEVRLRYLAQEVIVRKHYTELQAIARRIGIPSIEAIRVGRGTPAQVHALTQALLDLNKLPPPEPGVSLPLSIRRMMSDYGIGFDCAGYAQGAFLAAQGITRAQAGFTSPLNEDLSRLSRAHFSRVAPEDSAPGDILSLGPSPNDSTGHRLIVLDAHVASPEEVERYVGFGAGPNGHFTVLVVDSSFGSAADPAKGGLGRETWLYQAGSKNSHEAESPRWGRVFPAPKKEVLDKVGSGSMPYDGAHPLLGVYHYSETH